MTVELPLEAPFETSDTRQQPTLPLSLDDLIKELSEFHQSYYPKVALQQAIDRREEVTPRLLDCLQQALVLPQKVIDEDGTFLLFSSYLLAQFAEPKAFPLLLQLGHLPLGLSADLLGDIVPDAYPRMLASTYNGDLHLIKQLIEDTEANPYIRACALNSLVTLNYQQQLTADQLKDYLIHLLQGGLEGKKSVVWGELIRCCVLLNMQSQLPDIHNAFEQQLVDEDFYKLDDVEKALQHGAGDHWINPDEQYLINNVFAETESWACFQPEPLKAFANIPGQKDAFKKAFPELGDDFEVMDKLAAAAPEAAWASAPKQVRTEGQKIGRNDACPCGSGKKYKKCCMN